MQYEGLEALHVEFVRLLQDFHQSVGKGQGLTEQDENRLGSFFVGFLSFLDQAFLQWVLKLNPALDPKVHCVPFPNSASLKALRHTASQSNVWHGLLVVKTSGDLDFAQVPVVQALGKAGYLTGKPPNWQWTPAAVTAAESASTAESLVQSVSTRKRLSDDEREVLAKLHSLIGRGEAPGDLLRKVQVPLSYVSELLVAAPGCCTGMECAVECDGTGSRKSLLLEQLRTVSEDKFAIQYRRALSKQGQQRGHESGDADDDGHHSPARKLFSTLLETLKHVVQEKDPGLATKVDGSGQVAGKGKTTISKRTMTLTAADMPSDGENLPGERILEIVQGCCPELCKWTLLQADSASVTIDDLRDAEQRCGNRLPVVDELKGLVLRKMQPKLEGMLEHVLKGTGLNGNKVVWLAFERLLSFPYHRDGDDRVTDGVDWAEVMHAVGNCNKHIKVSVFIPSHAGRCCCCCCCWLWLFWSWWCRWWCWWCWCCSCRRCCCVG